MEAASSSSVSWLNASRGCSGFGSIRSTWTMRTPTLRVGPSGESRLTMAGESSRSSESRRAAAARKSGRAKVHHLPCQFTVRAGGFAAASVGRDRPPDERSLTELHGIANDAAEDVVIADDPQLVEHVAREIGAAVIERRQQAEDPEVPVQLQTDRVDHLHEIRQAL